MEFLRSAGALKSERDADEAALEQFWEKVKSLADEAEDIYERKKRQLNETKVKKMHEFNLLRKTISGESMR